VASVESPKLSHKKFMSSFEIKKNVNEISNKKQSFRKFVGKNVIKSSEDFYQILLGASSFSVSDVFD
jgi:hypothetical protein